MNPFDIHVFWFATLGILLTGYAILDGFDLGVGMLHLFARGDQDRRIVLNSIGPLWDGNEVWLVTFGGALFAAFPKAYATALSAFYLPFMVVLFALIGRAISIEFRSKFHAAWWRAYWDFSFAGASFLAALMFGVAVGNAVRGIPIGRDGEFSGRFADLVGPYSLLVGLFSAAACAMHGSIYLYLKTEGDLQRRIHTWMWRTFALFAALYVAVTAYTLIEVPSALENFKRLPVAWVVVLLNALAVANIPRAIHQSRPAYAFISSCCTIAALTFLFGMAVFPNLLLSTETPEWSLTIYNAASSERTLRLMRIIAFIGLPFVASYTAVVYWVFRGKTRLDDHSY